MFESCWLYFKCGTMVRPIWKRRLLKPVITVLYLHCGTAPNPKTEGCGEERARLPLVPALWSRCPQWLAVWSLPRSVPRCHGGGRRESGQSLYFRISVTKSIRYVNRIPTLNIDDCVLGTEPAASNLTLQYLNFKNKLWKLNTLPPRPVAKIC